MSENKILLQKGSNSRDLIRNYLTTTQTTVCHVEPVTTHNVKNIFFSTKVSNYFQHFLSDLQIHSLIRSGILYLNFISFFFFFGRGCGWNCGDYK